MGNLFGQHADLMEGFNEFLAQRGKNGSVQHQNKFSLLLSLAFLFICSNQVLSCRRIVQCRLE